MNEGEIKEINEKLTIIIRLLAKPLLEEMSKEDRVILLHTVGMKNEDIANLCEIQKKTVSEMLSRLRKKGKIG